MSKTNTVMGDMPLVYLASGSPRRRTILEELGISYRLLAADVDEIAAGTACETVEENARRKLRAGLLVARASGPQTQEIAFGNIACPCTEEEKARPRGPRHGGAVVVAADTVLEARGRLLGKPADETMAMQYLQMLSGSTAVAYSTVAVAVVGAGEGCLATETAEVHFKTLSPEVIRWYLATGEPMGRAGAFGIGQLGEVLTESVDGCYSCVSGLPKTALVLALARVAGEQLPEWLRNVPAVLVGTKVQLRSLAIDLA
jgi:septum formation protein